MEAACPGHTLEYVADWQGSVVLGRTRTMCSVGLWAGMEPPPSSKVLTGEVPSSVAAGRGAPCPLHPFVPALLPPSHAFPRFFHTPALPSFPPVFPQLSIPLGLLSISWSVNQGVAFPAQVNRLISIPVEDRETAAIEGKMAMEEHEDGI